MFNTHYFDLISILHHFKAHNSSYDGELNNTSSVNSTVNGEFVIFNSNFRVNAEGVIYLIIYVFSLSLFLCSLRVAEVYSRCLFTVVHY